MIWRKTHLSNFYEVSDTGLIKSVDRYVSSKCGSKRLAPGKILKLTEDEDGYYRVGIHCNGKCHTVGVHKLVAEAFIPNPDNKPCIDHINGNRQDNRVENLRWCTVEENNAFELARDRKREAAFKRKDNKVKIRQYSLNGEFIKDFNSSMDIERELGFDRSSIIRVCQGKQKTSYGYNWKYLD